MEQRLIDANKAYTKFYNRSMAKVGKEVLDATPTINAIPIPENATNGDVIKAMFPSVRVDDGGEWRHIFWDVTAKASFSQDWWNAPYKREE